MASQVLYFLRSRHRGAVAKMYVWIVCGCYHIAFAFVQLESVLVALCLNHSEKRVHSMSVRARADGVVCIENLVDVHPANSIRCQCPVQLTVYIREHNCHYDEEQIWRERASLPDSSALLFPSR